jgi:hypothetical protein
MNNKGRLRQLFKACNKTKMQLSRKKFGRKNLFSKIVKKRHFRLEFFFFQKMSTKESKLVFPTNLTIFYPNLQKKFNFFFYNFWKIWEKVEKSTFQKIPDKSSKKLKLHFCVFRVQRMLLHKLDTKKIFRPDMEKCDLPYRYKFSLWLCEIMIVCVFHKIVWKFWKKHILCKKFFFAHSVINVYNNHIFDKLCKFKKKISPGTWRFFRNFRF